jgi:hypothetical protein
MTCLRLRARTLVVLLALAGGAAAHEGPPYPLVVDQRAGPYTLSVWADPDVGTGAFFVIFDPDPYRSAADPTVAVEVWPGTERLPPRSTRAARQEDRAYLAQVPFDREERWQVRIHVDGTDGPARVELEVEVTPPGYGPWDLLIFGFPFLLVGALWVAVALRRRRLVAEAARS